MLIFYRGWLSLKKLLSIFLVVLSVNSFAQISTIEFVENKGQWKDNIIFKAKIPSGNLYLEQDKLTYQFYEEEDINRLHELHHNEIENPRPEDFLMDIHAFKITFLNSQVKKIIPVDPTSDYVNYFLGNDTNKWVGNVKKYKQTIYQNIYQNIDLKFYLNEGFLKYDFVVSEGGNPEEIELEYEGVSSVKLKKGELHISTSVNEIIEQKPYAYQFINGEKKEVDCAFKLKNSIVSFDFPNGYDSNYELVIDPILVFASYSGSSVDNWGNTATYDDLGNLYGGGVVFGIGYPTTLGSYQVNFNGGNSIVSSGSYMMGTDIVISKFSSNGSSLIYSTHLGGTENEVPHSLLVNNNNELLILGSTSSSDFPVSLTAYDRSYNGGSSYLGTIPSYTNGSDIVISKLNSGGSALLGSTYIGGSGNDGLNQSTLLQYNYADDFRGEIITDLNDNVYVTSSTLSTDFPTTIGVIQPLSGGGQDACVFKLTSNLDVLLWSSYLGGTNDDAGYSIQLDDNNSILLTGGTSSVDFPTTGGTISPTFQGVVDGWIGKLDNTGTTMLSSTFIGTPEYDQSFFVQSDTANNVYVVGQTEGVYPIQPANVYNVPNSGQFLHKLTPDLSSTVFSTTFGTGSGEVDIALSAFLVNDCNSIFVSGWGGLSNVYNGSALFSTTTGLPITQGAIQNSTDGNDYYLAVFGENAVSLKYATFFGGNSSGDHVDGGTSRFDKKGIVYQAVCASCGISNTQDFPTTPGVWGTINNSTNCNLGVFKMDLATLVSEASIDTVPFYCINDTVRFKNLSIGGHDFYWDFGDGDTSSLFEPTHVYNAIGTYNVSLVVFDSITCLKQDTDYIQVNIGGPPNVTVLPVNSICLGDSIQLSVLGGSSYVWSPNYNILNGSTSTPTVWPDTTTTYQVITSDSCGKDTAQITIEVNQKNITIVPDTMICLGQSIQLFATGGNIYSWSPIGTLNNSNIPNPIATPILNTTYNLTVIDSNNCIWDTLMKVDVVTLLPDLFDSKEGEMCLGDSVQVYVSGTEVNSYEWTPNALLSSPNDSITWTYPKQTTAYVIKGTNICGTDYDTVDVVVNIPLINSTSDTAVCVGEEVRIWASGGIEYLWDVSGNVVGLDSSFTTSVLVPTRFGVQVTDTNTCVDTSSVFVHILPSPDLDLGTNILTILGTQITFDPETNGVQFWWSPSQYLNCDTCKNPVVSSTEARTFYLTVANEEGCLAFDSIKISYEGSIYVPNSFSPDGDGLNDVFSAYGEGIVNFEMNIFNRWGELVFNAKNILNGWNGNYKGALAKNDVYVWKIKYKDILGESRTLYGTVTLLK